MRVRMRCVSGSPALPALLLVLALTVLLQPNAAYGSRSGSGGRPFPAGGSSRARTLADGQQPMCMRHAYMQPIQGIEWFAPESVRQKAQTYHGGHARLRVAMDRFTKLKPSDNFTIVVLGGSIAAGQGAVDGHPFPTWTEKVLKAAMGPQIRVHNAAVPGTLSSYMSVCHNMHVPKDADMIVLDYSINDDSNVMPIMDNSVRRPFERLLRKLLNYPKQPPVMLIHSFVWHRLPQMGPSGLFYPSSERDFHEFGVYYGLSELSVKAAAWNLMRKGVEGFQVHRTRGDHSGFFQAEIDGQLKGKVFYWDIIHPDGQTGHRFMGEITAQAILDTLASVRARPVTPEERQEASEPLPPPMLQNNWESASDKCFIGPSFVQSVIESTNWEYRDEGKDKSKPKLGFISTTPGSILKIKVNTTSPTGNPELPVMVELAHLKSYAHMGQASITCAQGCMCDSTVLDGLHAEHTSQLYLHEVLVSQHDECVIAVEVLSSSKAGQGHHKVKIAGVMVSEESGEGGIKNYGAIQMVAEGSNKDKTGSGTFEIREWAAMRP